MRLRYQTRMALPVATIRDAEEREPRRDVLRCNRRQAQEGCQASRTDREQFNATNSAPEFVTTLKSKREPCRDCPLHRQKNRVPPRRATPLHRYPTTHNFYRLDTAGSFRDGVPGSSLSAVPPVGNQPVPSANDYNPSAASFSASHCSISRSARSSASW